MKRRIFLGFSIIFTFLLLLLTLTGCFGIEPDGQDVGIDVQIVNYAGPNTKTETVTAKNGILRFANGLPVSEGYEFVGLFDAPEGGTQYLDANGTMLVTLTDSVVLYARWNSKPYYVRFDGRGAEISPESAEMTVLYGSTVTEFPAVQKTGYDFVGWEDIEGTRYSNGGSVLREKQSFTKANYAFDQNGIVTLYAVFEVRKLTVTFDYNDGSYDTEEITVDYGSVLVADQFPQREIDGRMIAAWASNPNETQQFNGKIKENITLYAVWQEYRTFLLNDSVGGTETVRVLKGEVLDLSAYEGMTRPGYRIVGWYDSALYSGNPITEITYGSGIRVYYAKWEIAEYLLTFDPITAGVDFPSVTYRMGDTAELPVPEKLGHTFNGWCTEADLSDTPLRAIPDFIYGDITLYASFMPTVYRVSLHSEGGNVSETEASLRYGESYTLPVPVRKGYRFLGWYDENHALAQPCTNELGESLRAYKKAQDCDVYARWEIQTFTVTYETDGGTEIAPTTAEYNSKLVLPEDPTKPGMIFEGWYDKNLSESYSNSYRVTADVTLYAKWIQSTPISTVEELKAIATNPSANYHLTEDINLGGTEWTMVPEFSGVLNGRGHKICNFTISSDETVSGFFGINAGTIKNLIFSDFTMSTSLSTTGFTGGMVCAINTGRIQDCYASVGSIAYNITLSAGSGDMSSYLGCLVGKNEGEIDNCSAIDVILNTNCGTHCSYDSIAWIGHESVGVFNIGGVVGKNENKIFNCHVGVFMASNLFSSDTGNLYADAFSYMNVGGVAGTNVGTISNSSANVSIEANASYKSSTNEARIGGIVGMNENTISNSSARGKIKDTSSFSHIAFGGFVAHHLDGAINNCYADVTVEVQHSSSNSSGVGGFVAFNAKAISNSFCSGKVISTTALTGVGGFVGKNNSGASINKCFATGNIVAPSAENTGYFIGVAAEGSSTHKCYYNEEAIVTVGETVVTPTNLDGTAESLENLQKSSMIFGTLDWDSSVWQITEDGYPRFLWQEES